MQELKANLIMSEKFRKKIQKLLALAQSDNPHEAERARVQAEKMMAKHCYSKDELEVSTVAASVAIKRRKYKESEDRLLVSIMLISGTNAFSTAKWTYRNSRREFRSTPSFMGITHDAELAAYTWDVLYSQLLERQKIIKKEYRMNAAELERYSIGWVYSASKKLDRVFGRREAPAAVEKVSKEITGGMSPPKSIKTKSVANESGLMRLGISQGEAARLNGAAGNSMPEVLRLS